MSILVLGAGCAGLGAALSLHTVKQDFTLLEAGGAPGGLARTHLVDGFAFDRSGHFMHFESPTIKKYFLDCGVECDEITRRAAVIVDRHVIPYPFQFNLWALPAVLRRQALDDLRRIIGTTRPLPKTLADVLAMSWGETLSELFFRPYNEKLWGRPLAELPADCTGRFHPPPNLYLVERGCREPIPYIGYNGSFFYPRSGCIGAVTAALAEPLKSHIHYESAVTAIDLKHRKCITGDREWPFEQVISTIPLPTLLDVCGLDHVIKDFLNYTEILNVNVGFRGRLHCDYHWIYLPDRAIPFHRVGLPKNVNMRTCPDGCASLSIEYTMPAAAPGLSASMLADLAIEYLSDMGLIECSERLLLHEDLLAPAYVTHPSPGRILFNTLRQQLTENGIHLAGRFGEWDYFSMEDAFRSGLNAGALVLQKG